MPPETIRIAMLLAFIGAALVYVEFLRPGWIVPGVTGAALLIAGIARFANCPLRWPGFMVVTFAAACFLMAARGFPRQPLIAMGAASIAGGAIWFDRLVGFSLGVPFAIVTGYLVNAAITARRNKRESV